MILEAPSWAFTSGNRATVRDITESRRAEEHVARLHQQNELILCSPAGGILGLDLKGLHTFVNPAAARMLGYEVEELLGRPSHSLWHHTKPDGSPYPEEDVSSRFAGKKPAGIIQKPYTLAKLRESLAGLLPRRSS